MKKGLFITGTDTGIGKTRATLYLMWILKSLGLKVLGMKPVASGAFLRSGVWVNEDALAIRDFCSEFVDYELVNPYLFRLPVAPHIAAEMEQKVIEIPKIMDALEVLQNSADVVVVEGVGGWKVPLNESQDVADLAFAMGLPVVQVVALKLGCINHGILTGEAITASGCRNAGWISNIICEDFSEIEANTEALEKRLASRKIITIPFETNIDYMQNLRPSLDAQEEILRVLDT